MKKLNLNSNQPQNKLPGKASEHWISSKIESTKLDSGNREFRKKILENDFIEAPFPLAKVDNFLSQEVFYKAL